MNHPEQEFERRCVAEARRQGWTCWKNEHNGLKGIPDYSMLNPDGRFILVEFKRPDGKGRAAPPATGVAGTLPEHGQDSGQLGHFFVGFGKKIKN